MSNSPILDKREQWLEQKLGYALNFLKSTSEEKIFDNTFFWRLLPQICSKILNYVKHTKSFKCHIYVTKWLLCFKIILIRAKVTKINYSLTEGPMKNIFSDLLHGDSLFPPWFLKYFFNFCFDSLIFNNPTLGKLYNMICRGTDFNIQKAFIEIICQNFEIDIIHDTIIKNIEDKELQILFNNIVEDCNENTIRLYLNKLNNNQIPVNIFSFKVKEIKLNDVFLGYNLWVDINIIASTFTFECKKRFLSSDETPRNSSEDDNCKDIITIKMNDITHLRYKGAKHPDCNEGHELILELTNPCKGFYEPSNEFLSNYRIVIIYVTENADNLKDFIYNFYTEKLGLSPENLDSANLRLNLNQELEASPSTVTDSRISSVCIQKDKEVVDYSETDSESTVPPELDEEQSIINSSESKREGLISGIFQTPKPCNDANMTVDESIRTDDSDDLESPEYEHLNYDTSFLCTPQQRSTNISVAATSEESDSGICKENTGSSSRSESRVVLTGLPTSVPETPFISIRSPESNHEFSSEVINLITPDLSNVESQTEVAQKQNLPEENLIDEAPLANSTAQKDDDQLSHISLAESSRTRSQNRLNVSQESRGSITSSQGRKRRYSQFDPLYHPGDDLSTSFVYDKSKRGRRGSLPADNDTDESEFDTSSFYSDKEKDKEIESEYTYTRTRRVKKPDMYQSSSDTEPKRRKPKNISRESAPSSVKRIKTILPVRSVQDTQTNTAASSGKSNQMSSENVPSCSRTEKNINTEQNNTIEVVPPGSKIDKRRKATNIQPEVASSSSIINAGSIKDRRNTIDVAPTNKVDKKRRITNPNNVDHLEEQPESEVYRISVPTLKNKKDIRYSPALKATAQNCRQQFTNKEDANTSHAGENANETFQKSPPIMDRFDKMKYNMPSTQNTSTYKQIPFFSSSSYSSQDEQIPPDNHPINNIDHEEIFPPPEDNSLVLEPTAAENIPAPSTKKVVKGRVSPSKTPPKCSEKIGLVVKRKGRKPKEVKCTTDPETNKKRKAAPKKIKGNETDAPAPKPRKKKTVNKDLNQTVPSTSGLLQNALQEAVANINSQELAPINLSSSSQQSSSCNQCGTSPLTATRTREIQDAIKSLCKLCIMTFTSKTRVEYCTQMEKFFKDLKKQK